MNLKLKDKISGCLYGAIIGAEIGKKRQVPYEAWSAVKTTYMDIIEAFKYKTEWYKELPNIDPVSCAPLSLLVLNTARAYIKKNGRITPEDWALELTNDTFLPETKDNKIGDIYTSIELLKEGMNPRLTGLGAVPMSNVCTAMIPVGIFHAGDPEAAFLDAVEIASVVQRPPAVEWAALTAASIAEALRNGATVNSVIDKTLELAFKYAREAYEEIHASVHKARECFTADEYLSHYVRIIGSEGGWYYTKEYWRGNTPIRWALDLLTQFGSHPESMIIASAMGSFTETRTSIAGALAGALNGITGLPESWRDKTEDCVKPALYLADVVKAKLEREALVIKDIVELNSVSCENNSLLYEKIYGCLLAGAIGNVMGSPVEAQNYWEIDEKYPEGIRTILYPGCLETEDDNQMAMLLAETYLRRSGLPVTAKDFSETWKTRFQLEKFFYCMRNSYELILNGMDPRITGHWSLVTGSTVMCMEPVGIYHLCDPQNAYIDATSISYMYQRGLDVTAAAVLAAAVAEAFRPQATVDTVLKAALIASPKEKMITFDKRNFNTPYDYLSMCLEIADKYSDVLGVRKELYEKCLLYCAIDPLEVIGFSLAMFKISKGDVRLSAIGGTNIGRDSDTISGRAAMLSGTLRGYRNIPQEWIDLFSPGALAKYKEAAAALYNMLIYKKLPYMKERQEMFI